MDLSRWQQIERLYHAALTRPAGDLTAFLAEACAGDEALRREVEALLDAPPTGDGVFAGSALALAAQLAAAPESPTVTGRRLGVYQLEERIGSGGMGDVYRARDTRLGRDVAIKILPHAFTGDPERLARFEREARVLAALKHPNIGAIYGVEESDGLRALVLELVEGETLAERMRAARSRKADVGALSIAEALTIARQIAEAVDAAHEKAIVHRDLKPANVMVTPGGIVKVLDFGLATASASPVDPGASAAPTITMGQTRPGTIVGTVAYMSPEQARGQAVDRRTDIWAFGCVLYEMLTGRAAFAGKTASDTIARILERQPDWSALPERTPAGIRNLLRRCLEKDARQRFRDIGDVRMQVEDSFGGSAEAAAVARPAVRRRGLPLVFASIGLAAAGGMGALWLLGGRTSEPPPVTRSTVTLPAGQNLDTRDSAAPMALSPDGRRVVFASRGASGIAMLHLRELDAFEARPIAGTEDADYPFFSPDGQWVAFFADGRLKRVSIQGGSPFTICDAPEIGRGGTWGPDGTIVFDPGASGLMQVAASGGRPEPVTSRDPAMDAQNLSWPQFLPGGLAVLATVGCAGCVDAELAVLSLETREWHLLGAGSQAQYSPPGYLVYHALGVREGELHAVAFDADRLAIRGEPVSVLDAVFRASNSGAAYFVVAHSGTLVFAPGGYARALVQVDRSGRRTPLTDDRRGFRMPRISPDGRLVAVTVDPRPSQIWTYDLLRRSGVPYSTDGHHVAKAWTPDGRRIAFSNQGDMHWKTADGSGAAERLLAREYSQYPEAWSHDGRLLLFGDDHPTQGSDIWVLPMDSREPKPLVTTRGDQWQSRLSPDGRWLAYMSNETGPFEVYVQPFPNVDGGKWVVSTGGGAYPAWSPTAQELFYLNGATMMSVAVDGRGDTFTAGVPEMLFTGPFETGSPEYDVFPDGSRFVMVEASPDARATQIHVVLNWQEELRRLVGAD